MSNFTPGPWEMVAETEDSDGAMVVALLDPNTKQYVAWHMSDENARLISAAPELLAVVRMVVDYATLKDFDDTDNVAEAYENLIDAASTAIAKAEGRDDAEPLTGEA